jgi:drug/metabolite transporter (DMT)-like permease
VGQLNRRKGVLVTTAGIVLISPDSLILRLVGGDPFTLLFARCGLACLTLIVLSLVLNRAKGIKQLYQLTRAEWFAVMNTTVANTFVICSVGPLFGAILSRFFLGELVATRTWVAAFIIIIGLTIIFSGSLKSGGLAGDCAALLGAIGMSAIFVVIRKHPEIVCCRP